MNLPIRDMNTIDVLFRAIEQEGEVYILNTEDAFILYILYYILYTIYCIYRYHSANVNYIF